MAVMVPSASASRLFSIFMASYMSSGSGKRSGHLVACATGGGRFRSGTLGRSACGGLGSRTGHGSHHRSGLLFHFHLIFGAIHIDGGDVALNVLDFYFVWFPTNGEFEFFHCLNN